MDMDDDVELPFVVTIGVGNITPDGIALRITYATSAERHAARQWDTALFGMTIETADRLARTLLDRTAHRAPATPNGPRH
jgi:hypothetical protein